jgi:hypothetical protein
VTGRCEACNARAPVFTTLGSDLIVNARDWARVEKEDAPSGSEMRLSWNVVLLVLEEAVRMCEYFNQGEDG